MEQLFWFDTRIALSIFLPVADRIAGLRQASEFNSTQVVINNKIVYSSLQTLCMDKRTTPSYLIVSFICEDIYVRS